MAELMLGQPLFPGESGIDQLVEIIKVLGTPTRDQIRTMNPNYMEHKFPQIKPLKRGGGRRYYRPDDIGLLRRISDLLYIQGYTIKGVQRLLRDGGGQLSEDIPPATAAEREAAAAERGGTDEAELAAAEEPLPVEPDPAVAEAERLRVLLQQMLDEMVAIRALLR